MEAIIVLLVLVFVLGTLIAGNNLERRVDKIEKEMRKSSNETL